MQDQSRTRTNSTPESQTRLRRTLLAVRQREKQPPSRHYRPASESLVRVGIVSFILGVEVLTFASTCFAGCVGLVPADSPWVGFRRLRFRGVRLTFGIRTPHYISEEYWNKLSPSPRQVLASKWFNIALWNTAREVSFSAPSQMKGGSTELNFGKAWLTPLDEAEVVPLLTKPRQLRDHPKSSRFLGGTVFWDSKVSEAVTTRCKFIKDTAFPVELQLVGHGVTPPDTTLWGHLKYNGRLAIVRGVKWQRQDTSSTAPPPCRQYRHLLLPR